MLQFTRTKVIAILGTVFLGILFAAPNVMPASVRPPGPTRPTS